MKRINQVDIEKNLTRKDSGSCNAKNDCYSRDSIDEPEIKADYILVYEEEKSNKTLVSTNETDEEFTKIKNRSVYLENLVRYGLEIKKVIIFDYLKE